MRLKNLLLAFTITLLAMTSLTTLKITIASPEAVVYISPAPPLVNSAELGENFTVEIRVKDISDLYSWELSLEWDASLLNVTTITEGSFLKRRGNTYFVGPPNVPIEQTANNTEGRLSIGCALMGEPATAAATGSGTLATATFVAKESGECDLHLYDTTLVKMISLWETEAIPHTTEDGLFAYPVALVYVPKVADGTKKAGDFVTINVTIEDIHGLYGFELKLNYSTTFLEAQSVDLPTFLNQPNINETKINGTLGVIYVNVTCKTPAQPVSGNGTLASINFEIKADSGKSPLTLYDIRLVDNETEPLLFSKQYGYFTNIIHDIAVVNIDASPQQEVMEGEPVTITIAVQNRPWSTQEETFDVEIYAETLSINTTTVTNLSPGTTETFSCVWNTTGLIEANYTIEAEASILTDEVNITDNEYIYGSILVKSPAPPLAFPIEYIIIIVVVAVAAVAIVIYIKRKKS